jgi:hypothetical protein
MEMHLFEAIMVHFKHPLRFAHVKDWRLILRIVLYISSE